MTQELSLWVKKLCILLLAIGILYLLYSTSSILVICLVSGFLTLLLNPLIEKAESYHIPAWVVVLGVYIGIFLLGSIVVGNLAPIIFDYFSSIISIIIDWINNAQSIYASGGIEGFHLNPYLERVVLFLFGEENINHTLDIIKQNAGSIQSFFSNQISLFTTGSISVVSSVGGFMTDWALIGVMTFLMVLERKSLGNFFLDSVPQKMNQYLQEHFRQFQHVTTAWMKAMFILCLSIFFMTYISLLISQVAFGFTINQAFVLATISGIMEFIPYAGPIISLILGVIIGLGVSWKATVVIALLYLVVQQIEGNFLVPYVMSKSLNLSPLFVFIVMLIGASLGGILGIILAVPIAGIVKVVYTGYMQKNNQQTSTVQKPKGTPKRIRTSNV